MNYQWWNEVWWKWAIRNKIYSKEVKKILLENISVR